MSSKISRGRGTWSNLMLELWRDVFANPYMLSLFPMFFVSTWYVNNFCNPTCGLRDKLTLSQFLRLSIRQSQQLHSIH